MCKGTRGIAGTCSGRYLFLWLLCISVMPGVSCPLKVFCSLWKVIFSCDSSLQAGGKEGRREGEGADVDIDGFSGAVEQWNSRAVEQ